MYVLFFYIKIANPAGQIKEKLTAVLYLALVFIVKVYSKLTGGPKGIMGGQGGGTVPRTPDRLLPPWARIQKNKRNKVYTL